MPNFIALSGKKFGRLTVLDRARNIGERVAWNCLCKCGNKKAITAKNLRNGDARSCGCLHIEGLKKIATKHGNARSDSITTEYYAWQSMIKRCTQKNRKDYARYGGRGIKVCKRWLTSFSNFLEDMGPKPSKEYSINRIDNEGDYKPSNCNWASIHEQARNTRRNIKVILNGKTLCLTDAVNKLGLNYSTINGRIQRGHSPQNALEGKL